MISFIWILQLHFTFGWFLFQDFAICHLHVIHGHRTMDIFPLGSKHFRWSNTYSYSKNVFWFVHVIRLQIWKAWHCICITTTGQYTSYCCLFLIATLKKILPFKRIFFSLRAEPRFVFFLTEEEKRSSPKSSKRKKGSASTVDFFLSSRWRLPVCLI